VTHYPGGDRLTTFRGASSQHIRPVMLLSV